MPEKKETVNGTVVAVVAAVLGSLMLIMLAIWGYDRHMSAKASGRAAAVAVGQCEPRSVELQTNRNPYA